MFDKHLHWHSMMVHAAIPFGPVAALAFLLGTTGIALGPLDPPVWILIERFSIVLILLVALPSTLTGIFDRNKMYAKWHSTHKVKLFFSIATILATGLEIAAWCNPTCGIFHSRAVLAPYSALVVVINNIALGMLSIFGLKITLGRQSLPGTSYTPDLFNKKERVDILEVVRNHVNEKAKTVEVDEL